MPAFGHNLARLRVASQTGSLPPDLGRWAVAELEELAPAAERIDTRNALLREAAALVSGSLWARARRIEAEIQAARSRVRVRSADLDGVRALVVRAVEADPDLPTSHRQLRRILSDGTSAP